jgi:hypothetical protein
MRYTRAQDIETAVRGMYEKNGYVVLSQVRNGTGFSKPPRTADMMIFSTWPSRGMYCEGIEIKVSRSDLQSELANPQKADDIARYCKSWWLAVPDDLITPEMMIPEAWGVISVDEKGKGKVSRKGPVLTPEPMDSALVCSVLRNFSESHVHVSEIEPKLKQAKEEALKSARADKEHRLKELEDAMRIFKEASGIDLLTDRRHPIWEIGAVGEAVKLIMALRGRPEAELREAADRLKSASAAIETALAVMKPVEVSA